MPQIFTFTYNVNLQYIVHMVYFVALNNCRNFVGYNRRYGYQSVRYYSAQDIATSLLINELKSSVFVPGFLPWAS